MKKAAPKRAVLALSGLERLVVDRVVDQLNGWKVATEIDLKQLGELVLADVFDGDAKAMLKGHFWKRLRLGPKQALLPLAVPEAPPSASTSLLDEGSMHAVEFDLDQSGIEAWVRNRLLTLGRTPVKRQPKANLLTYNRLLDQVDSRFLVKRSRRRLRERPRVAPR